MLSTSESVHLVIFLPIEVEKKIKMDLPEGQSPFGRSVPARHQLRLQALAGGSPDRAKKGYTLCALHASVVKKTSVCHLW
jgi:hypothetical protein